MRLNRSARTRAIALLAGVAIVSACTDAKAPNAANFRKAIDPLVADDYCRTLNPTRMAVEGQAETLAFPVYITAQGSPFDPGRTDRALLESMVGAGLLKRTEVTADARHAGSSEPMTRQALLRFDPTAKATGQVRAIRAMTVGGEERDVAAACIGKGELVAVERWTEPADVLGQHVTQVTYSERATDLIDGLPDADRAKLGQTRQKTVSLVLMSDGWKTMAR